MSLFAQNPQPEDLRNCGITELTIPQLEALEKEVARALKNRKGQKLTAITYIPIRPHILRRSDGTGRLSLSLINSNIERSLCLNGNFDAEFDTFLEWLGTDFQFSVAYHPKNLKSLKFQRRICTF